MNYIKTKLLMRPKEKTTINRAEIQQEFGRRHLQS